jgi:hypothetical protein
MYPGGRPAHLYLECILEEGQPVFTWNVSWRKASLSLPGMYPGGRPAYLYLECILEEGQLLGVICIVILEDLLPIVGLGNHLVPGVH